jgi:hypothetical protein
MNAQAQAYIYSMISQLSRATENIESRANYIGTLLDDVGPSSERDELEQMFIRVLNTVRP